MELHPSPNLQKLCHKTRSRLQSRLKAAIPEPFKAKKLLRSSYGAKKKVPLFKN
jgi:dUTPase